MMKKANRRFWLIGLASAILLIIFCAALFLNTGMQTPEYTWKEDMYTIRPAALTYPDLELDAIAENTNLANPLTQEAEQRQQAENEACSKDPEQNGSEQKPADGQGTSDADGRSDRDEPGTDVNESGVLETEEPGSDAPRFEEEYEDLPEDALVQQSIQVSDLMQEIGLDDPAQILYVRNITGIGSDSLLQSVNGAYAALLSTKGTTIIQVKYKDADGDTQLYIKKINYVRPEGSTPTEKQPLIRTNLKENGIYNQATLNFDVWVTNYRGKALAYSDMEVMVNGSPADYIGEMNRQTYSTQLRSGANTINIKITDEYQYTVRKTYTVFYQTGKGRITISLEAGTIGIPYLIKPKEIDVESGISLSHVLDEYLRSEGFTYTYTGDLNDGFYLAKIHKKNLIKGYKIPADLASKIRKDELLFDENGFESLDDLGEFDFCQGSGWMYAINGLYSSYGFNKAYVQDGDTVRIRFTLAYGKDIGGYETMAGTYGVLDSYGKEW